MLSFFSGRAEEKMCVAFFLCALCVPEVVSGGGKPATGTITDQLIVIQGGGVQGALGDPNGSKSDGLDEAHGQIREDASGDDTDDGSAGLDFGDAESPGIPTLLAENGARHVLSNTLHLGFLVDPDTDGQPIDGDDSDGNDDEDGITFDPEILEPDADVTIRVFASQDGGFLNAWIDWDGSGTFEPSEQIAVDLSIIADPQGHALTVPVPADAPSGATIASRFRLSSESGLGITGIAPDGEVEDHLVQVSSVADLTVVKSIAPTEPVPGQIVTWTITVTNAGPQGADNVAVTDDFAAVIGKLDSIAWTCSGTGGATCTPGPVNGVLNDLADLPYLGTASSVTYVVEGLVKSSATGTLDNTVSARLPLGILDLNTLNPDRRAEEATVAGNLVPVSGIVVTIDGPTATVPGTGISYTVEVANTGSSDAPSVRFFDTPPLDGGFVWGCQVTGSASCGAGAGVNRSNLSGPDIDELLSIPSGEMVAFAIEGVSPSGALGTLDLSVQVDDQIALSFDVTLNPEANLVVTKSDDLDPVMHGLDPGYSVAIVNNGPSDASDVRVTEAPPGQIIATGFQGCSPDSVYPECRLGVIQAGEIREFQLVAEVSLASAAIEVENTVQVSTITPGSITSNIGETDGSADELTCIYGEYSEFPLHRDLLVSAHPAMAARDGFFTVWQSEGDVADEESGVRARRVSALGQLMQEPIAVNTYTTGQQRFPAVAAMDDGHFVVAWESYGSDGGDADLTSIQSRTFDASGEPVGQQFQVNVTGGARQSNPDVAAGDLGAFFVVWDTLDIGNDVGRGIVGRKYASDGTAQTGEIHINSFTTGNQHHAVAVGLPDGGFVAAWQSDETPAEMDAGILAQIFDSSGNKVGGELQVNSYTLGIQSYPAISADIFGNFVLAWQSDGSDGSDASGSSIQFQRFAPDGGKLGGQIQANSYAPGNQTKPSVALGNDGNLYISWTVDGSADGDGTAIFYRAFGPDGIGLDDDQVVNSASAGDQVDSAIAVQSNGDPLVVAINPSLPCAPGRATVSSKRYLVEKADLQMTVVPRFPDVVPGGGSAVFELVITNDSAVTVSNARVVSDIPSQMEDVSWSCTADAMSSCSETQGNSDISTLIELGPNAEISFLISGNVDPAAMEHVVSEATVIVGAGISDPNIFNNTDSASILLRPTVDLVVTATVIDPVITQETVFIPGQAEPITAEIELVNYGPTAAIGARAETLFPMGELSCVWSCSPDSGSSCVSGLADGALQDQERDIQDLVDLPANGRLIYTLVCAVLPTATEPIEVVTSLSVPSPLDIDPEVSYVDVDLANNIDIIGPLILDPMADLALTLEEPAGVVSSGEDITYIYTVSNAGYSTATDVSINAFLPEGVSVISPGMGSETTEGCEPSMELPEQSFCVVGSLEPDAQTEVRLEVRVSLGLEGDTLVSHGTVTAFTAESDYANNVSNHVETAVRPELKINSTASDGVGEPAVAADSSGNFVAVWESDILGDDPSSQYEIRGRIYDAGGLPVGEDFLVSEEVAALQFRPDVAMAPDGSFLVVWERQVLAVNDDFDVVGRYFDSTGIPLTTTFQINQVAADAQLQAAVAYSPNQDTPTTHEFVIVWESKIDGIRIKDIRGRRWSSALQFLTSEIQINDSTIGDQLRPAIAILNGDGDFVVAWQSTEPSDQNGDTDGSSIHAQRFFADGTVNGEQFQVNNYELGDQNEVAVATTGNHEAAFIWTTAHSAFDPYGTSIHKRVFCRDGSPSTNDDELVNATGFANGDQVTPAISFLGGDEFVAAWKSSATLSEDVLAPIHKATAAGIFVGPAGGFQIPLDTENVPDGGAETLFSPDITTAGDVYIGVWKRGDSIFGRRVPFTIAPFAGDSDQDGVINECDVCAGLDDNNMDLNGNDIPDCLEDQALTVMFDGTGSGTITALVGDFECQTSDGICVETSFELLETVTLQAVEDPGSLFLGWSSDQCEVDDELKTCEIEMIGAPTVIANFTHEDDTRMLSLATDGEPGQVLVDPSSSTCGVNCFLYTVGTEVRLEAVGEPGSVLASWSAGCECGGSEDPSVCPIVMDENTSCLASFELEKHDVIVLPIGDGAVSVLPEPDDTCGMGCYQFFHGREITLEATANAGSVFTGWSGGGCSDSGNFCSGVVVTGELAISAGFTLESDLHNLFVLRTGTGSGRVSSTDGKIDCGVDCSETYTTGYGVTLIAEPDHGSDFVGWGDGCANGQLAMIEDVTCVAFFEEKTPLLRVIVDGSGLGRISSFPGSEIRCTKVGGSCVYEYEYGAEVTLIAIPSEDPDSRFGVWGEGPCGHFGAATQCDLSLTENTIIVATFYHVDAIQALTVVTNGDGSGTVDFSPLGISCGIEGVDCYEYDTDETVTLTAQPAVGSTFAGWSGGGCVGTGPCMLTLDQALHVSATFIQDRHDLTVAMSGAGSGRVDSVSDGEIDCPSDCVGTYTHGMTVVLEADHNPGSAFIGWSGACAGTGSCVVDMDEAKSVTAHFALGTETLTVIMVGTGIGTVTSLEVSGDPLIDCPEDCTETYVLGTEVVLEPMAEEGSIFMGWADGSGPCSGLGSCTLTMNSPVTAVAEFSRVVDLRTVQVLINGEGTAGFLPDDTPSCGTDCRYYSYGTAVSLSVEPDEGYTFDSWSANCFAGQIVTFQDYQCIATLIQDTEPPQVQVIRPSAGDLWRLSLPDEPARTETLHWGMSDNQWVCRVDIALEARSADGSWVAVEDVPGLPHSFDAGGDCPSPGLEVSELSVTLPTMPPSGRVGLDYRFTITAYDPEFNGTQVYGPVFYIDERARGQVETLVIGHPQRMLAHVPGEQSESVDAMVAALRDFNNHHAAQGVYVDLAFYEELEQLYSAWDQSGRYEDANRALFGCAFPDCPTEQPGLQDILQDLKQIYPNVKYLLLVGDDQVIPFARLRDRTSYREEEYIFSDMGLVEGASTVAEALAENQYLSDDPLASSVNISPGDLQIRGRVFHLDLRVGRLVETAEEIIGSLENFLAVDGILDLDALDPLSGQKVLVTGYDFLTDSAWRTKSLWQEALGENPESTRSPVNGELISESWIPPCDQGCGISQRRELLAAALSGYVDEGGTSYGILNLNGHATHYEEGVPETDFAIAGLPASEIYGPDSCQSTSAPIDLLGSLIYSVGCHGGLTVPGSCSTDANHSLDLPQTYLARGALGYLANSGYGWGLLYGVGYSEQMIHLMTQRLLEGGTVVIGDAVKDTKRRYYSGSPTQDVFDDKTLMQWTFFGFPMFEIATGIPGSQSGAVDEDYPLELVSTSNNPDHLLVAEGDLDLTAYGFFEKFTATGELVDESGCPSSLGCYYSFFRQTVRRAGGPADLPIQPYLAITPPAIDDIPLRGILWEGGSYEAEHGWIPTLATPISNQPSAESPDSTPRKILIDPVCRGILSDPNPSSCSLTRPEDLKVIVSLGEVLKESPSDSTYNVQRLFRKVNMDYFFFRHLDSQSPLNCDQTGPIILPPSGAHYHHIEGSTLSWEISATDDSYPDPADGVWRVVVVYDDQKIDAQGFGHWRLLELEDLDQDGIWGGELEVSGLDSLTYVIQAIDKQGNVSWLSYMVADLPSELDPTLPQLVEVEMDRIPPVLPVLSSPSHTVGEPSTNTIVQVAWSGASDEGSGVAGFAVEIHGQSFWVCDETQDYSAEIGEVFSDALSEGEWYFHLCAVDGAGNWSQSSTIGPFVIEAEQQTENHRDSFDTVGSFAGDTGSRPWPGPWRETPADGGSPGWGQVRVITDGQVAHGVSQLRIRRDDMWVERPVDLSGAGSVTWSFEYRREALLDGHYVAAEVTSDDVTWTEVARMAGPADDTEYLQMSVGIPVDTTKIRFANPPGLGMGNSNMVFFDNVEVLLDLGASMKATVLPQPDTVTDPGGEVTFVIRIENTSPSGALILNTLDGSLAGETPVTVSGSGTCLLPQSVAVGDAYACELARQVEGVAGNSVSFELSVAGHVDGEPLFASAEASVGVTEDVEANAKDAFSAVTYSGDDGTVPWASNWIEAPIDGSQPAWGNVRILEDTVVSHVDGPYQAFIRNDQLWLRRKVDLTGFSAAELDFEYRRSNLLPGQRLDIEVSTDGVNFERLASLEGFKQGTDLAYSRWTPALDLSAYISDSTWIQFSNLEDLGMGSTNAIYLDNVEIRLQSGSSITASLIPNPETVTEPGGEVTFQLTVTNHSPLGSVILSDLQDDQIGDLHGVGTCARGDSIAAGSAYACEYPAIVSGSAGSVVERRVDVTATANEGVLNADTIASVTVEALGQETVRDELNAVSYHGNDGTQVWTTPWIESASDGGAPYYGQVRVEEDALGTGPYALRIRRDDLEVKRQANLLGFAQASLSFDYRRNNLLAGHHMTVEVSTDGATWTELDQFVGPALDLTYNKAVYDLSPWITAGTWIRFYAPSGQGMGNGNLMYFDNVEIQLTEPIELGARSYVRSRRGNLLANPSFADGLGYWELVSEEPLGIVPSTNGLESADGHGGTAKITGSTATESYAIRQCLPIDSRFRKGLSYGFGGMVRVESATDIDPIVSMSVEYFVGSHCEGEVLSADGEVLWVGDSAGDWQTSDLRRSQAPNSAQSARVWVVVQGQETGGYLVWLDDLIFRRAR